MEFDYWLFCWGCDTNYSNHLNFKIYLMDDIKSMDKNFSDGSRGNSEIPDFKETTFCLLTGGTRIGGRKENQDSYGYSETKHGLLIVVCDGMGGAKGGKTASLLAVD